MASYNNCSLRFGIVAALGLAIGAYMAMGCGSSGSATSATTGTDSTTASTKSLSTVPSSDLSSYDSTTSTTASADISDISASKSVGQKAGSGISASKSSIAGCHTNAQKEEMVRLSQQAELGKCYAQAMEKSKLITIPDGSTSVFSIVPPKQDTGDLKQKCSDIPADNKDAKAACEKGGEGPGGGTILVRIGVVDGKLQMDECENGSLTGEATYSVSGTTATSLNVRSGKFQGNTESGSIDITVEKIKGVSEGVVTLDSGGSATATAKMNSFFGKGVSSFGTDGTTVTLSASFSPSFKDPFTKVTVSSTMKAYAQMGNGVGTAKFSFTGKSPPMPVANMIPFDVPAAQKEAFITLLSNQLGVTLTASSLLCPNPDQKDPTNAKASSDKTVSPMVLATNGECATVTHEGVESFSISNSSVDGNYGNKKITQTYIVIDNDKSSFFTAVNKFDLSTISGDTTVAFSRNWDCKGTATEIDFSKLTAEQITTATAALKTCFALEEKAHGAKGMSVNCQQKAANNVTQDLKDNPPVGGVYDGSYTLSPANALFPPKIVINKAGTDKYCLPNGEGVCGAFTITPGTTTVSGLSVKTPANQSGESSKTSGTTITKLVFNNGTAPTTVTATFKTTGFADADQTYTKDSNVGFTALKECTKETVDNACKAKGITDCGKCGDYCMTPGAGCGAGK